MTHLGLGLCRIQKKSRLQGSEPEEDFAFYVVFEEGLVICINSVSTKSSVNVTSTVKGIGLLPYNFSRHAQYSPRTLASFDFFKRGKFMIKILQPKEG